MGIPPVRVVCFDLGGVVIRICRSWSEGCTRAGLDVRAPDTRDASKAARGRAVFDYQTGRIDDDEFARRVSAALDGLYSPDEVMAVHHAWMIDGYRDVDAIIHRLNAADLHTACLSNTNAAHWTRLGDYPAFAALRQRLASHELGLHKPDRAIYDAATSAFGVDPAEILFFDDLPENVDGAASSGWRAVTIDPLVETAPQIVRGLEAHGIVLT
ncbi:MAG: HAD-IA family hydrolase [Phycisphaerales bacterium]|nr:HAD-IA family hydrolase [Phycisphaerales bacterium]